MTRELDSLLVHLAKVETGLSKVYERLSKKEGFTPQVKKFWFELMNEELMHAFRSDGTLILILTYSDMLCVKYPELSSDI